jgi:hypothetical protein
MSNYIDTFQSASVGAGLPTGWSAKWNTPTWSVIEESSDKLVHMPSTSPASRWGVTLDSVDSDADRDDVDIIVKLRFSATASVSLAGLLVRATGTSSADSNGYACVLYGPDKIRINKYVAGVLTSVTTVDSGPSFASDAWYFLRFRCVGTSLQAKVWTGAVGDQPSAWLIDITDASVTGVGGAGFFATGASVQYDFAEIAIATNGDVPTFTADTTAPVLTLPTGVTASSTTATGTVTTDEGNGTLYYLATTNTTESSSTVIVGGAQQAVSSTGLKTVTFTGLTAATLYYAHYVQVDTAGNISSRVSSTPGFTTSSADVTAPNLSAGSGTQTGSGTATLSVTTDENNGTLYAVVSATNTAPSVGQIQLGQNSSGAAAPYASNQAITSTGAKSFGATGLSPSTTYYPFFQQKDASNNNSTVVGGGSFTTAASGTKGVRVTLYNGVAAQASMTGLTAVWWDVTTPVSFLTTLPKYSTSSATTDSTGRLQLNLAASTALGIGGQGFLLVFKLDGGDAEDSLEFGGIATIVDIS